MKFEALTTLVRSWPVIESKNLRPYFAYPALMEVQLARWKAQRKLIQLRRGMYVLAEAYRKVDIFEPFLASLVKWPSYLSLEKALEFHDLIPEAVSVYTSVTPRRGGSFHSSAGDFEYRHIQPSLFWGYRAVTVRGQTGFIAAPEKALLDFLYFKRFPLTADYLESLRLQNLDQMKWRNLFEVSKKFHSPRLQKAMPLLVKILREEKLSLKHA